MDEAMPEKADLLIAAVERLGVGISASNGAIALSNDRIAESNARISELGQASKRQRLLIRILAVSVAFDIVLSLGLGVAFLRARQADNRSRTAAAAVALQVTANNAQARATCLASNATRALATQGWDYLLTQSEIGASPAMTERAEALRTHIDALYVPQSCPR